MKAEEQAPKKALIRRQATGNTIVSYFGVALGYLNVAIVFPRLLGTELFGLTQVLISAMLFASNLGSLGLQFVNIRYRFIFDRDERLRPIFLSFVSTITIIGIVLTNLALLIFETPIRGYYSENAALLNDYYILLFPLVTFGIMGIVLDSYSRSLFITVSAAFVKEVLVRIFQLGSVLLYAFDFLDEPQFLWLFSIIQAFYVLVLFVMIHRAGHLEFNWQLSRIPKKKLKDILKFSGVSMLNGSTLLANNVDVLIVGSVAGLKGAAMYSIASAMGRVVMVPARAVQRIANSVVAEAWSNNDVDKIRRIYQKSAISGLIVGGAIFLLLNVNLGNLLTFIPKEYSGISLVVLLLTSAKLMQMAGGVNAGIITSSRDYALNMVNNTFSFILVIVGNQLLVERFGIIGAAYTMIISVVAGNLVRHIFLRVKYDMEPLTWSFFKVVAIGFACGALHFILPFLGNVFLDIFVRSTLVVGSFVFVVYRLKLSEDFTEMMDGFLNYFRKLKT